MDLPTEALRVDFRFADSEDTTEIITLVNDAFSVEKGDTGFAFTTKDRINADEVDACLHGGSGEKRWLVLETPRPEEKMVAAALTCTGIASGTGSVEVLAVERSRQGTGLGSQMLRRAEGILLNFCCRFVRLRVPQWREDVLAWASRRGYEETGGGVWGEMDGENAEDLTRTTRYFILTRDLLTDSKLEGTFGGGTARFAAATAAAAERVAAAKAPNFSSRSASAEAAEGVSRDAPRGDAELVTEEQEDDDSRRLAGFLLSVLKGLGDADKEVQETTSDAGQDAAAPAPVADISLDLTATSITPHQVLHPSVPTTHSKDGAYSGVDRPDDVHAALMGSHVGSEGTVTGTFRTSSRASASVGGNRGQSEKGMASRDEWSDNVTGNENEESVESLLGSLMRALNTEQGRADFARLTSTTSSAT